MSLPFLRTLQGDRFFQLLILVGIGLSFSCPLHRNPGLLLSTGTPSSPLSGLMLLTKGVELSGYFDVLGRKMVRRFATERRLAMFMVLAAALLLPF
ncbi:transporter [Escherichia coli]|uniref:Transporter n=1 Tax=Escherichia coli TaxID=562 RepID=A0A2X3JM90_ECOLX|nr:transporter [Escherichia coli]